jgi:hypothetical protein
MKTMKLKTNRFIIGLTGFVLVALIHTARSQGDVQAIGKYLCIDYKPFFPIGLYHLPDKRNDDEIWKEVADAGFNYLLSGESGRYGIYVSKPIPWKEIDGQRFNLMEINRDESFLGDLRAFLEENENDTTMLCWHAPDEPSWFGPTSNVLRLGYQAIKKYSEKPVWLNIGPSFTERKHYNTPYEFLEACDVLSEDIYPIPDGKRKEGQGYNIQSYLVGEHTERLVKMGSVNNAQHTPIWMVLQGFGWGDFEVFDNPKDFIPPTRHEMRYMAYDAIVHGATGLIWYGPFDTKSDNNHIEFWDNLKLMASELRDLYPVLTSPNELLPEKLTFYQEDGSIANHLKCKIKLLKDRVIIFVVNTRPEPLRNVKISAIDDNQGQLTKVKVLTEDRVLAVSENKSWVDDFEGYDVHIYETDLYFSFMRRYYDNPVKDE